MRHPMELKAKAEKHIVEEVQGGFVVTSAGSGRRYAVVPNGAGGYTCDCKFGKPFGKHRHASGCSHALAVELYTAEEEGRKVDVVAGGLGTVVAGLRSLGQDLWIVSEAVA